MKQNDRRIALVKVPTRASGWKLRDSSGGRKSRFSWAPGVPGAARRRPTCCGTRDWTPIRSG